MRMSTKEMGILEDMISRIMELELEKMKQYHKTNLYDIVKLIFNSNILKIFLFIVCVFRLIDKIGVDNLTELAGYIVGLTRNIK